MTNHRSSYFAYGSNMDAFQLKKRCKGGELEANGIMEGLRCWPSRRILTSIAEQRLTRGFSPCAVVVPHAGQQRSGYSRRQTHRPIDLNCEIASWPRSLRARDPGALRAEETAARSAR